MALRRGLRCADVLSKLDAFVEGALDAEAKSAVVTHVSGCDRCARFGGTYADVVKRIRAGARVEEPAPSVLDRLRAKLDAIDSP